MDEYRVVAADSKEYGPVDLSGLLQWIRDGRVLKTTLIRKGQGTPVAAETLPELAVVFAPAPPRAIPSFVAVVPLPAEFKSWEFIGKAWELVKPNWLNLALIALIYGVMCGVPYLGVCVTLVIGGALMVGINRAILGMIAGTPPTVAMMFSGFDRFGQAFLAQLIVGILVFIGFLFLVVPGVILAIMWMFVSLVLSETSLDFWPAMQASAELTAGYRWELFCLLLACFVVALLGILACGVGILVAQPVILTSVALAYRFLQARHAAKPA